MTPDPTPTAPRPPERVQDALANTMSLTSPIERPVDMRALRAAISSAGIPNATFVASKVLEQTETQPQRKGNP